MNDDVFYEALMRYYQQKDNYWVHNNIMSKLSAHEVYELLRPVREEDMPSYYDRIYNTRGDEVATLVLEAYAKGTSFETLLKKSTVVRQYWNQMQAEKVAIEKAQQKEKERQAKLAEKRAAEQAKKEEVMKKLTPEELEAFGLVKKPRKVTKR